MTKEQKSPDTCCVENCTREVEKFSHDDWSSQCGYHNDRDIERSQERREWNYYHN